MRVLGLMAIILSGGSPEPPKCSLLFRINSILKIIPVSSISTEAKYGALPKCTETMASKPLSSDTGITIFSTIN